MTIPTKDIWDQLAPWWDEAYGEGDLFHRTFLFPTIIDWVSAKAGMHILDIGCGNGALARLFAQQGAQVTAVDFSKVFIEKATQRSKEPVIDYRVLDATDLGALEQLSKEKKFDVITCSMVLHDMSTLDPLATVLTNLLNPKGKFIFSIPHPCFNSGLVEVDTVKEIMEKNRLLLPDRYIHSETFEIYAKPGQPVKQRCFHRSLSEILNEFFKVGLALTGLVEPVAESAKLPPDFLWGKFKNIPPAIIARMKVMPKG